VIPSGNLNNDLYIRFAIVAVIVNTLLLTYAWYFYVRKIKALKALLDDVEVS